MELGQWIVVNKPGDKWCYAGKITHVTDKTLRMKQADGYYENTVLKAHVIYCGDEGAAKRLKAVWEGLRSTYYDRVRKADEWFKGQVKALIEIHQIDKG